MSITQASAPSPEAYRFRCCLSVPIGARNAQKIREEAGKLTKLEPLLSHACEQTKYAHLTIVDYYAPSEGIKDVVQQEVAKKVIELAGRLKQKNPEIAEADKGWGLKIKRIRVLQGLSTDVKKDWVVGDVSASISASQTFLKTIHDTAVEVVKRHGCVLVHDSSQYEPHVSTHKVTPPLTSDDWKKAGPISGEFIEFGISANRLDSTAIDRLAHPTSPGSSPAAAASSSAPAAPPEYRPSSYGQFQQREPFSWQHESYAPSGGYASSSATAVAESLPPPAKKQCVSAHVEQESLAEKRIEEAIETSYVELLDLLEEKQKETGSVEVDLSFTEDENAELEKIKCNRDLFKKLQNSFLRNRHEALNHRPLPKSCRLVISNLGLNKGLESLNTIIGGLCFYCVSSLDLSNNEFYPHSCSVEDVQELLKMLKGFKRIEDLYLKNCPVLEFTQGNVQEICKYFPKLKHLDISGNRNDLPEYFQVETSDGRTVQVVNKK